MIIAHKDQKLTQSPIATVGWTLVSGKARKKLFPDSFEIPSIQRRSSLERGEAAQLLFDIETKEAGKVIDRGVDRMWVIVVEVLVNGYRGVLDSDPGLAENLELFRGDLIDFSEDHVCKIDRPPEAFLKSVYSNFFQ